MVKKTNQSLSNTWSSADFASFQENIILKWVNTNNLKNIDVTLPKNKLITITWVSGSGKSSLAFDTIYKEWQFRYIESLSSYLRQFFNLWARPEIEYTSWLSPAIAIEQNKRAANIRSSVWTITEIDDYLRLLFAKLGESYCYNCGSEIRAQSVDSITEDIVSINKDKKIYIISALGEYKNNVDFLKFVKKNRNKMDKWDGYTRYLVLFDDDKWNTQLVEYFYLESPNIPEKYLPLTVYGIYDRITLNDENQDRLKEDIVKMLNENSKFGVYQIQEDDKANDSLSITVWKDVYDAKAHITWFTDKVFCAKCNITYPEFTTQHFSSNRIEWACYICHGLGEIIDIDLQQIIDPILVYDKAILPRQNNSQWQQILEKLANKYDVATTTIRSKLPEWFVDIVIKWDNEILKIWTMWKYQNIYYRWLEDMLTNQYNKWNLGTDFATMFGTKVCPECNGSKLRKESLNVRIKI